MSIVSRRMRLIEAFRKLSDDDQEVLIAKAEEMVLRQVADKPEQLPDVADSYAATLDALNEFLDPANRIDDGVLPEFVRPRIKCADGSELSVQASDYHYCKPRNNVGLYTHVEVGFPSFKSGLLESYAERLDESTTGVYPRVPIETVAKVIFQHGGIKH